MISDFIKKQAAQTGRLLFLSLSLMAYFSTFMVEVVPSV